MKYISVFICLDDHQHILDDYNSDSDEEHDNEYTDILEPKEDFSLRIYYCSRTHSQLAQFVKGHFSSDDSGATNHKIYHRFFPLW